jgi:tetratricopeptide (TPR) repeat protein/predicted Ser/Thr protein kinase
MRRTPITVTLEAAAAAGSAPVSTPVRIGRYAIERVLGAGGAGMVYLAGDTLLGRMVALKLFRAVASHPLWVEREAQALARLRHPNVVAIYDVGAHQDQLYLAMEFVDGGTLRQWLEGSRSVAQVIDVVSAAGRGLAAAHAAGLVHRDFKIDNVLVARDGRVLVTDFGLAMPLEASHGMMATPLLSALGSGPCPALVEPTPEWFAGTPGYAAPETYQSSTPDPRADQFSLGVTLYRCLYGHLPYGSREAWRSGTPPPIPRAGVQGRVPRRVRHALHRTLSVEPRRRFADIPALLRAIEAPVRSYRAVAGVAVAGVVVALGFALAGARPEPRQAPIAEDGCLQSAERLSRTWNPASAAQLEHAFLASAAPYASTALANLKTGLDGYAAGWRATSLEVCKTGAAGARDPGEQERRVDCLAAGARQFTTLVEALAAADESIVATSVKSVGLLPDPRDCAAPMAQLSLPLLPVDPVLRREASELRNVLAEIRALLDVGRSAQARTKMAATSERIERLDDLPLTTEWRFAEVSLQYNDAARREHSLLAALWAAEASGNDPLVVSALLQLVEVVGYDLGRLEEARMYERRADAILRRMRDPLPLRRGLQLAMANALFTAGRDEEALPLAEQAAAYFLRATTAPPDRRVFAQLRLGALQRRQGHFQAAFASYRAAASIADAELGPGHPVQAGVLNNLGWLHATTGDSARAEQLLREAEQVRRAAYGAASPHRARPLTNLAILARQRGDLRLALSMFEAGQQIRAATDPDRPLTLARMGGIRCALGKGKRGPREIRRALAQLPATEPAQQVRRSAALLESAACHDRRRAPRAALRDTEAAEAAARDTADREQQARAWVALAGRISDADPERAHELLRMLGELATSGELPADIRHDVALVSSRLSAAPVR